MQTGKHWEQHHQRNRDMQETKQAAQPPSGLMQQGEHDCVSKRERLADEEVDEEPCGPGAIRVLRYQGA
jgi:hypothetical protein